MLFSIKLAFVPTQTETRKCSGIKISMLLLLEGEQRTTVTTTNLFGGVPIWYGPGHTGHTRNDAPDHYRVTKEPIITFASLI